jgi:hypothetical protein
MKRMTLPSLVHEPEMHSPSKRAPAKGMARRLTVFLGALVALALGACGLSGADKAANAFMTDLKTEHYADAFAMETPTLQQKFGGNVTAMEGQIKKFGQQPSEWSFTSINVTNGVAKLHGSATFAGGQKGAVDMELLDQSGTWLVAAVSFAK